MYEVDRMPFCVFTPLPIPHAFYGSNFADKLIGTQNARSVLTRSILDHAVMTNNPRYMVVKGGLSSPRELIDSRIGGLVSYFILTKVENPVTNTIIRVFNGARSNIHHATRLEHKQHH